MGAVKVLNPHPTPPPPPLPTCGLYNDRSKAVVPVLVLLSVVLWFISSWGLGRAAVCDCGTPWTFLLPLLYEAICFKPCLLLFFFSGKYFILPVHLMCSGSRRALCYFVLVFFSHFSIASTSLVLVLSISSIF